MKHVNSFEKGQMLISPEIMPNQSFVNARNGQLNYNGKELSFVNKNGTFKLEPSKEFEGLVQEIVGDFAFEDELILFTKSKFSETLGYVFSVKENAENSYVFIKLHQAEYNFKDGTKLSTVGVNENKNYKRVYFSDGEQPFRSINVSYPNLTDLSIEDLNMFPETVMEPPVVEEVNDAGSLFAMSVQYCYRLVSFNGNVTKFSMFSDRTVILNSYNDIKTKDTAGVPGDNVGKNVKISIDNINFNKFRTIEAFALQYEIKDVITSVKSLGKINLGSASVSFNHVGTEGDASVSIDEVLINIDNFKTVQVISSYENLFLAGNIGYEPRNDFDFDSKIIQVDSDNLNHNLDYNPDPKTYKYLEGTTVHGGKSNGYDTGNGIRISFTIEKEELCPSIHTDSNLPNNNVSQGFQNEEVNLLGNYDSFGNKVFNKSIRYSPNKASYQRDEVYRLAFKASKDNKDSFVKYIGDLKVPGVEDKISYLGNNFDSIFTTDSNGKVISLFDCSTSSDGGGNHGGLNSQALIPIQVSEDNNANACSETSTVSTYYHNGNAVRPQINNKIYTDPNRQNLSPSTTRKHFGENGEEDLIFTVNDSGVVVSTSVCSSNYPSSLTEFIASVEQEFDICNEDNISLTRFFHDGPLNRPQVGNIIYKDVNGNEKYGTTNRKYFPTDDTESSAFNTNNFGVVLDVENCEVGTPTGETTLKPFAVSINQPSNTCDEIESVATYYHNGVASRPQLNDIIYTNNDENNLATNTTRKSFFNDSSGVVYTDDNYVVSLNEGDKVLGMAIYLKVDLRLPQEIIDNYDFFEILRVKRDSSNKTIIDQGVLFPTGDKDESVTADDAENYPSGYQYKQGIQLPKQLSFIHFVGLYLREEYYKLGNIYSFDSPRTVSQLQDYNDASFNKVKILSKLKILKYENKLLDVPDDEYNAYNPSGGHYYINTGNYHRHVLYNHSSTPTRNINLNKAYFAASNQILPSGIFPDKDSNKIANIGCPMWSREIERDIPNATIDPMYSDNPRKCRFKLSSTTPTLFLKFAEDYLSEFEKNTFDGNDFSKFPFLDTDGILEYSSTSGTTIGRSLSNGSVIISNLVLVNLERQLSNQYGGANDFAITQNQYISIHKEKIVGTDYSFKVENGDVYIDMFHHQKFSLKDSPEYPSDFVGTDETGVAAIDKPVSVTSSISVALETDLPQIFSKGNKLIKSGIDYKLGEEYLFNDAYISQEAKVSITKPFNFQEVTQFTNLIQVSDIKLRGDQFDSWSVFKTANFHELDLDKGAITNFIKIKDLLFVTQSNKGLSQIFINPRAIVPTSDGRNITIGNSSPVNIEYSKEISKYGTSFLNSIAVSDDSFMYFNDKYQKLIMFKGGVVSISDSTFNQNSFYDKLKGKVINNVVGVYDERYSEMILSLNYGDNETVSVSYNNDSKFNLFNGDSDFISDHFINFKNKVFAKHNLNELYIKNEGPKGSFFEIVKDFEIEFVVNPSIQDVKIFDNFVGIINSNGIKFKSLTFKTNIVEEQVLLGDDSRYKIREGRHLIPYREKVGKKRMRGDYMIVKLVFDNSQNKEISITSVISAVRKSFK